MRKLLLTLFLMGALAAPASAATGEGAALLERLEQLGLDPPLSFRVSDVFLRHDGIRLTLRHGRLVFLEALEGRITGAVFEGEGDVLVLPPNKVERRQLALFTGSPILTETFSSAYFRFTDDTAAQWLRQIRSGRGRPQYSLELIERWEPRLREFHRPHSMRILLDFVQSPTKPYFYAGLFGRRLGIFDLVADARRSETILVGQAKLKEGRQYYDVWTSFALPAWDPPSPPARVHRYRIEATIHPDNTLEGICRVELEALETGPRALIFQLSRFLRVQEVTDQGRPLEIFQNAGLPSEQVLTRGNDSVLVVLVEPLQRGERRTLEFRYRGRVISHVGNGVLYVGARGLWYPSLDTPWPSHYEMSFRYPRELELVATGTRPEIREQGRWREALWVTEVPVPLAGFNLGNYEVREKQAGAHRVAVYANRLLEPRLARAAAASPSTDTEETETETPTDNPAQPTSNSDPPPLGPPSALADQVAGDVAHAITYFSQLFGPFPYRQLNVSQIPGNFAQGFPGLLYLPTYTFLSPADHARVGLDERSGQLFSQLVSPHETAHQWWGNQVPVATYRDSWLIEALASYSALLYLEQQPDGSALVQEWLRRYREDLLQTEEGEETLDSVGALTLGVRLDSSRRPSGYADLVYSKGPWVIHMLRELLRDPETGSDKLFFDALRHFAARGGGHALTTADFQQAFERRLPAYADAEENGRLDWFFDQWVRGTGIPRYRLEWSLRPAEAKQASDAAGKFWVEGLIDPADVSDLFTMPVPVYARFGDRLQALGRVLVAGAEVEFRFPVSQRPDQVLLDPHQTILCIREQTSRP